MGGGIPLPALYLQPQRSLDPLEEYSRVVGLRSLLQQEQQRQALMPGAIQQQQEQLQGEQVRNQMAQLELGQTQALNQAYRDALKVDENGQSTFDTEKLTNSLAQSGHGAAVPGIMESMAKYQKSMADASSAQQDAASKSRDAMGNVANAIKQANYDPNLADVVLQHQLATPNIPPAYKQELMQIDAMVRQNPQAVKSIVDNLLAASPQQRELGTKETEAQAKLASEKRQQAELEAKLPGGALENPEQKYIRLQSAAKQGQALSDADRTWMQGYERNKTMVPAFNFNLQAQGLGNVPLNPQQQATAQAITEGRMSPPGSFALKTPYWQAVMGEVMRQDPQWSEQRAQLRKDFTLGKHSGEINAINTALQHTGVLGGAIDALNNGDIQQLNRLANAVGVQVGKTPKTTFDTIVDRLGPELASAYAVGTGGEREQIEKGLSSNMSPAQLKTNVQTNVKLLQGKINSLRNQWDQNRADTMSTFDDRFLTPEAKQTINQWTAGASGAGTVMMQAPNGQTKAVSPDQVEHYKSLGAKIISQ